MIFGLAFLGMVALRLVTLRLRRKAHLGPLAPLRLSRGREGEGEGGERKREEEERKRKEEERERKEEGKEMEKEGRRRGGRRRRGKGKEKGRGKGEGGAAPLWPRGLAFFLLGPCLFLEICTFAF